MNNFDLDALKNGLQTANSALAASRIAEEQEKAVQLAKTISKQNAKRDATIIAGAEASVAQKELLEQQLKEVKEQNAQLKENYRLLNELYESAKTDAQSSTKEAKANKIFGWVSFGVGTLIGIAGIVLGIIF